MRSKVNLLKFILLVIVIVVATCLPCWSSEVLAASSITSDFTQLNAAQIVTAMGAGWNLGNQLEAIFSDGTPEETAWGNPIITKALIQKVKSAGFKTIRIPISYLTKIGSAPEYTINAAWLSRIKEVVDYAYSEGLYVIINIHGDGYNTIKGAWLLCNSSAQTTIKAKYQKVWKQIANTFVNYNEHLIFESMNEIFDGDWDTPQPTHYANLNAYNQIFIDTVRQTGGNNSARWLLIPGWNTNIDFTVGNYGFALPTDTYRSSTIPSAEKRIMLSAHYYSPWDFCGDNSGTITQWGATATDPSRKSTWGQEDYMESQLKLMYTKFVTQGYPVVIGEYGATDKTCADSTNNKYRQAFAETLCAYCKQYGSIPVYWDNGYNGTYSMGLFDRSAITVTQQGIIDAIMRGIADTTSNSTIAPKTATFDLKTSKQADIVVTMTLNGHTLNAINNGTIALISGTDYTVSGTTVTIRKSYLAKQAVGTLQLTFDVSAGKDPVLTVNVSDSSDQSSSIKIQEYNGNPTSTTNSLYPRFKLINTNTTAAINLSNVKIRYYYTIDTEKTQSFVCDWSTAGVSNVTGRLVKMSTAKTGADYYLEISFASGAGNLAPGGNIEIQGRISKSDWSNYTQTGDYSFNSSSTTYTDWNKVTGYLSDILKWGNEPN